MSRHTCNFCDNVGASELIRTNRAGEWTLAGHLNPEDPSVRRACRSCARGLVYKDPEDLREMDERAGLL